MGKTIVVLAALLAAAPAVQAQSRKKPKVTPDTGIAWTGDFDGAVKEAQARNVPILYIVTKDY